MRKMYGPEINPDAIQIPDGYEIASLTDRWGDSILHSDPSNLDGPLWLASNSFSIEGVVGGPTFQDAWEDWEDEIAMPADWADIADDLAANPDDVPEGYSVSPNGKLVSEDFNGQYLNPLTPSVLRNNGIRITFRPIPEV